MIKWGIDAASYLQSLIGGRRLQAGSLEISFTPSRHFREGITDRAKSMWGGWVIQTAQEKIWFSGDGGYGKHFAEIGRRFGAF